MRILLSLILAAVLSGCSEAKHGDAVAAPGYPALIHIPDQYCTQQKAPAIIGMREFDNGMVLLTLTYDCGPRDNGLHCWHYIHQPDADYPHELKETECY